jgi:hypothetical protein
MYKLKILQNMGHVAKIKLHIPNMNKGEEAWLRWWLTCQISVQVMGWISKKLGAQRKA